MADLICKHCGQPLELHGATLAGPLYKHRDPERDKDCSAPEPGKSEAEKERELYGNDNLVRMWKEFFKVPLAYRDEFLKTLLGSLSHRVDPLEWEGSLMIAKQLIDEAIEEEKHR